MEYVQLVKLARKQLGSLKEGWAYYLVIPGVFGGQYDASNMRTAPLEELIRLSGEWALELKICLTGQK